MAKTMKETEKKSKPGKTGNLEITGQKELHYAPKYENLQMEGEADFIGLLQCALKSDTRAAAKATPYSCGESTVDILAEIRVDIIAFLFERCMKGLADDIQSILNGKNDVRGFREDEDFDLLGRDEFDVPRKIIEEALSVLKAEIEKCTPAEVIENTPTHRLEAKYNELIKKLGIIKRVFSCLTQMSVNIGLIRDEKFDGFKFKDEPDILGIETFFRLAGSYIEGIKEYDDLKALVNTEVENINKFLAAFPKSGEELLRGEAKPFDDENRRLSISFEKLEKTYRKLRSLHIDRKNSDVVKVNAEFGRIEPYVPPVDDVKTIIDGKTGKPIACKMEDLKGCAVLTVQSLQEAFKNPNPKSKKKLELSMEWILDSGLVSGDTKGVIIVYDGYNVDDLRELLHSKPLAKAMKLENIYFSARAHSALKIAEIKA